MTAPLDATLDDLAAYVEALRSFVGSGLRAAPDEFEEALRLRAADAGASAATAAVDEAAVPSLRDFLGRA